MERRGDLPPEDERGRAREERRTARGAERTHATERETAFEEGRRAGVREGAARTLAQTFCLATGLVLIAGGVLGFFFGGSSFDTGGNVSGEDFIVFEVNGWHNIVHLATGAFLVLMAGTAASAISGALVFGLLYVAITVWGLVTGDDILGLVPIDDADNILHASLAGLGLLVGLSAGSLGLSARRRRRAVT